MTDGTLSTYSKRTPQMFIGRFREIAKSDY